MTSVYPSALDTAALLKARLGRPFVLGGPHATVFPERVLAEAPILDYVVRGEGEETLLELVEALEGLGRELHEAIDREVSLLKEAKLSREELGSALLELGAKLQSEDLEALEHPVAK